jgi:hypothetical protein
MNYPFWLFVIGIPVIVFGVRPERGRWLRSGRLILAVVLGYALANVALHWQKAVEWEALEECMIAGGFHRESKEGFEACGHHVNTADGAALVFYLYLGWIPAAAYTGFYELLWRWRYRRVIGAMGSGFKGRLFSNLMIAAFFFPWVALACLAVLPLLLR